MNYQSLFRKLEDNLAQIERSDDVLALLSEVLHRLVDDFHDELGIIGGRIYAMEADAFVLREEYPAQDARIGFRLPMSYAPVQQLMRYGFVLHDAADPEVDPDIEGALRVGNFAAIRIGDVRPQLLAFSLRDSSDREHVIYTLNTIRQVVSLKLRKAQLEDNVAKVRAIQQSLLPRRAPKFADYDVWGTTRSAEEVGGDLYDFLPISERSLGVAIADSAGHGLPAALQARDAIIGLRMGVQEQLRITATIEKLNHVVSRSALASRFISLFYCEVEPNGNLVYCNAGHTPALLYRSGEFEQLSQGGLLLGPNPDARYERGYTRMDPGSILLLYTDGITEAENGDGDQFGVEGLRQVIASGPWSTARELVDGVFEAVRAHSPTDPPSDDQTVVGVIRQ